MEIQKIEAAIEAILFTMGQSVEVKTIAKAVEQDAETTKRIIHNMMDKYESEDRGIRIVELEDRFQMCTKVQYYEQLIRVASEPKKQVLSEVVLETLASSRISTHHQVGDRKDQRGILRPRGE